MNYVPILISLLFLLKTPNSDNSFSLKKTESKPQIGERC